MAKRRMISCDIIDSDAFLDMPQSTQLLYFHLNLRADDDGFINNPKKIMRMVGTQDDDMKVLITKKFVIPFESGVVVIKHWKIHNYIAKDRYTETKYKVEKSTLLLDENNAYTKEVNELYTGCTQNDDTGKVRLGKDRLGKASKDKVSKEPNKKPKYMRKDTICYGEFENVYITNAEYEKLIASYGKEVIESKIEDVSIYIENVEHHKKYTNHYSTILAWLKKDGAKKINEPPEQDNGMNERASEFFASMGMSGDIGEIDF